MRILLIDDQRTEESPNIGISVDIIARNYWFGIEALKKMGPWDLLLLDHDLASFGLIFDHGGEKEYTGYDIMCFLEENPEYLPGEIRIVSSNPVGRRRMQTVIDKLYK